MHTSLAAGYVTLLKTSIGSGILAFPYLFKTYGLTTGIVLVTFSGFFAVLGMILYTICSKQIGRNATLSILAMHSMPYTRLIVEFSVFLKCFGVATSYLIITKQLLPVLLETIFGSSRMFRPNIVLLCFITIIAPFSYFQKLDKLKYTSFCGVFAIVIVTIASIYRYNYTPSSENITYLSKSPSYAWLGGFGKFVFAFTCHQNIFTIHSELRDNSLKEMKKLIYLVASSAFIIYVSFGAFNYFIYGDKVKDDVLENYPNDILSSIVRGLYVLVMGVSYPLQVNPCRIYLLNMINIFTTKTEELGLKFIATTSIIIATYTLAASGMDLGVIYTIIGSTASTFMCLIFPALFYFNMNIDRPLYMVILSYMAFLFGVFVFIASIFNIILTHI